MLLRPAYKVLIVNGSSAAAVLALCCSEILLSALAGEEDHLPALGFFPEDPQGGFQTVIVKTDQGIVQDQGGLGRQLLGDCQPQGQIQLVRRAGTAPLGGAEGVLSGGAGVDGQVL